MKEPDLPAINRTLHFLEETSIESPGLRSYTFSSEDNHWTYRLKEPLPVYEDYRQKKLRKLIQFINEKYMNKIETTWAAGQIGLSISEFCRFFKQQTGLSFVAYINKIRISQAVRLLTETNLECNIIGYDCGFPTTSHFYKVFTKQYGISPNKYRKN